MTRFKKRRLFNRPKDSILYFYIGYRLFLYFLFSRPIFINIKLIPSPFGSEVHHLIEKRFAGMIMMDENHILSIVIDVETHKKITKLMATYLPTGKVHERREIWEATVRVYKELGMTEYLDELQQMLMDAGNKDIMNWREMK